MSGRGVKGEYDPQRADDMAARFKRGETLQAIGNVYGLTRERVRQILTKYRGLVGRDGGAHFKNIRTSTERAAKRDEKYLRLKGCTWAQYKMLVHNGATRRFLEQRRNAIERSIEWKFNLWDWWVIWRDSGYWSQRGRGQGGYVMARKGDTGAYEIGNVFICLAAENSSNRSAKKNGLPRGVSKKEVGNYVAFTAKKMCGGKTFHVGSFNTPEAAHNAYLQFTPERQAA